MAVPIAGAAIFLFLRVLALSCHYSLPVVSAIRYRSFFSVTRRFSWANICG